MCDTVPAATYISVWVCSWCGAETEGSGFGLVWSITVLEQYSHIASLLAMVSAPVAGFSHTPCLIGAAKQIYVQPSLTALPSPMQVQVHREPGAGEPCSCTAKRGLGGTRVQILFPWERNHFKAHTERHQMMSYKCYFRGLLATFQHRKKEYQTIYVHPFTYHFNYLFPLS